MQYVYILRSKLDGSLYIGTSGDLKQRLRDHNWHTVKSTKSKAPYILIHYSAFLKADKAFAFEKYLKTGSGIAFYRKHFL